MREIPRFVADFRAALVVVAFATVWSSTVLRAQVTVQPFYLEKTISEEAGSGTMQAFKKEISARRSDGSTVRIDSYGGAGGLAAGLYHREITFSDGRKIELLDHIQVKSTYPPLSPEELNRFLANFTNPRKDCGVRPPIQTDAVNGVPVVVTNSGGGGFRITSWQAPTLGCETVYSKAEQMGPNGSSRISAETKPTVLILGEPDPQLFEPGANAVELKPSEALDRSLDDLIRALGVPLSAGDRAEILKEAIPKDRAYLSGR